VGEPMNYGQAAPSYASHRWTVSWKLDPLLRAARSLVDVAAILDVGCGTGDYLEAVHQAQPVHRYHGFDISPEMLSIARSRCPWAVLEVANAELGFPVGSAEVDLVYAVDVLHHIQDYDRFFEESARVLRAARRLLVITDSEEDIRARTLAQLFPTTVALNLQRYPSLEELLEWAARRGFGLVSRTTARGHIDLDDRFMQALAAKALSELRLIPDDEHRRGMGRAEALRALGGRWLSQTTVLEWTQS
jgi:SAM-dependent methyltransferase